MSIEHAYSPSLAPDQAAINQQFDGIIAANKMQEHMAAQNPFGLPAEAPKADLHAAVADSFDTLKGINVPVSQEVARTALENAGISAEQARKWRATAEAQYNAARGNAYFAEVAAVQHQQIARASEQARKQLEDDETEA
jgi:hypothetical protein